MKKIQAVLIMVLSAYMSIMAIAGCSSPTIPPLPTMTPANTATMTSTATPVSTSVSYYASADARIGDGSLAFMNMGACTTLIIGNDTSNVYRVVVNFSVGLPSTVTVTSAVLSINSASASGTMDVTASGLTTPWTEGTSACGGTPGADVSWYYTSGNTAGWTTAGGDYNIATKSPAATVNGPGQYNFQLNKAMVQAWVNNPAQNYGLLLKAENETANYASFADKAQGTLAPKLTIYYY
jgi:hypothetical protein